MNVCYLSTEKFASLRERIHWFDVNGFRYGLWSNEPRDQEPSLKLVDDAKEVVFEGREEVSITHPDYHHSSIFFSLVNMAARYCAADPDFQGAEEQAQNVFTEVFYDLWGRNGFGKHDLESEHPWGLPWLWDSDFEIDIDAPSQHAERHFEENREEIASLTSEEN